MQNVSVRLGVTQGAWQKVNISSAFFEQGRWKRNKEWRSARSARLNTHTHTSRPEFIKIHSKKSEMKDK